MLTAQDIMTRELITVSTGMDITSAAKLLVEKGVNGIPVVDGERLVGIICQSDMLAQQKKIPLPSLFTLLEGFVPLTSMKRIDREVEKIAAVTVGQAMTPDPVTVDPHTDIEEVAALMADKKYHTLPVIEDGHARLPASLY